MATTTVDLGSVIGPQGPKGDTGASAAHNLLDNSDFTNPVNQRGKTSYSGTGGKVYTIDRWLTWSSSGVVTVGDRELNITEALYQNVLCDTTKTYTCAVGLADGTVLCGSGNVTEGSFGIYETVWCMPATECEGINFRINFENAGQGYKWAALYEGTFTVDTLPAYVPKGYAAELAECQRYYLPLNHQLLGTGYTFSGGAALLVPFGMRDLNPTFTSSGTVMARVNGSDYALTVISATTSGGMIKVDFSGDVPANYPCAFCTDGQTASLSADL